MQNCIIYLSFPKNAEEMTLEKGEGSVDKEVFNLISILKCHFIYMLLSKCVTM